MRHGSLFSGGGGFDLAAEAVGWKNVFHCERDKFCQTVLKHYWPGVDLFTDIKEFDARPYQGKIDIITGGFPCQPFSTAGKRRGTDDDRYLWPDMLRIIREVRPRWVVGENVFGLINWNGGLVLRQVQSDLEAEGFQVWPYVLPAAGVNAPHQRYRVFIVAFHPKHATSRQSQITSHAHRTGRFVAEPCGETEKGGNRRHSQHARRVCEAKLEETHSNANGDGCQQCYGGDEQQSGQAGQYAQCDLEPLGAPVTNTIGEGLDGRTSSGRLSKGRQKTIKQFARLCKRNRWQHWPTQSPLCGRDDGLPAQLDGITFPKWRTQSVKMYGNAVVPQVIINIFKAIKAYEAQNHK